VAWVEEERTGCCYRFTIRVFFAQWRLGGGCREGTSMETMSIARVQLCIMKQIEFRSMYSRFTVSKHNFMYFLNFIPGMFFLISSYM